MTLSERSKVFRLRLKSGDQTMATLPPLTNLVIIHMEKYRAHCTLSKVKGFIASNKVRASKSAYAGAAAIGLDFDGMVDIVQKLRPSDFQKSMTSYNDHRIWQDVYKPHTAVGSIYLKLVVIDDVLILSCKEL